MKKNSFRLLFILLIGLGEALSANVIGSVTRLKGVAQVDRMGGVFNASVGTNIQNKDIITTQNNSLIKVQMIDGGVVNIGENSIFGFEQYSFNNNIKAHMVLQRGFFRIKSGKIGKLAPRKFRVDTKTAVIGIRGTDFYALVNGNREDIGCMKGEIFVDTPKQRFNLKAGERVVKKRGIWQKKAIKAEVEGVPFNRVLGFQRALMNKGKRVCPAGQIWSPYLKKCILAPDDTPITQTNLAPCKESMVRDPQTNMCVCPSGTTWSNAMNMCVTKDQRRQYCQRTYPGSIPALNERECECPKSLWWSETYQRCIDPVDYCQRRVEGSIPVFTRDNEISCECPKGYYLGKRTNKCYRYSPKPHRVHHRRPHRVVHRRPQRVVHEVHHHKPNYIVPALIGAAIIGGAIISHHHHRKHRRHHHRRYR
jgi:hypothetical protein